MAFRVWWLVRILRVILLLVLALGCMGCPQRRVTRTVALSGLTGDAPTSAIVSVNNPEVQSALETIDGVLALHGFVRTIDTNLMVSGSLVSYAKYTPEGYATLFPSMAVSLNRDALEFTLGNRPHLTSEDKQILKAVRTELKSRYGADRIKTRH